MKILFLVTKSDTGGAQKYVRDLAASLPQEKFQTEIITGGKSGIRFLSNSFRPYFLFLNDIAAVIEIFFCLRKHRPDILHLNSSKAGVVGAIAATIYNVGCRVSGVGCRPIKVIFTAHGWVFNPKNRYSWLRQHCYIFFHKFAALFQDAIINVSAYDRELALRYHIAPAKKLFTIHNGIDVSAINFLNKDSARAALLQKVRSPESGVRNIGHRSAVIGQEHWIGSIGRLVVEKNYQTLIDAAALVKGQLSIVNCQFFIIGEGYERAMLEKKIADLGLQNNVFLLGALPNAEQYLKAFDVFVMPSIKEGLPYTLLEAMAARIPIIATKTGGMPEILEPTRADGGASNGLVVPPRDATMLAEAIKKLLANTSLQQTFGTNAQAYAQKELTLERMTKETTGIYKSMYGRL
ncbi:MAG: glycosyltransferase [bacterium]|nr:glycosyltransferase [bacterium]